MYLIIRNFQFTQRETLLLSSSKVALSVASSNTNKLSTRIIKYLYSIHTVSIPNPNCAPHWTSVLKLCKCRSTFRAKITLAPGDEGFWTDWPKANNKDRPFSRVSWRPTKVETAGRNLKTGQLLLILVISCHICISVTIVEPFGWDGWANINPRKSQAFLSMIKCKPLKKWKCADETSNSKLAFKTNTNRPTACLAW